MTVAIIGLGLIGGSLAKAYRAAGHTVLGCDFDSSTADFAYLADAIDEELDDGSIGEVELILLATPHRNAVWYLNRIAHIIPKTAFVIDCCGVKRLICEQGFLLAEKHGFTFVGGHPMAGTHNSGFKYSDADLFRGASMVLVPPRYDDMQLLDTVKTLLAPAGFGSFSVTTAERHDQVIAYTSQLAHVVSNAFIKSPTAREHHGFSAGSYKDLTRVARLNPEMWSLLFIDNADALLQELDTFIASANEYRDALADRDIDRLRTLLREGSDIKAEVDAL